LAILVVASTATSCEKVGAGRMRRTADDTIVFVLEAFLTELDPRFAVTNNEEKISRLVAPGLVTIDNEAMEPRLELAESVVPVDPLTWDVTVRADAKFHDGTPLTARDVVYTYMSTIDPAVKSPYRKAISERFSKVEAISERTARFHLVKPIATFVTDLEYGIVSHRAEATNHRFGGGTVVGAGPFMVVELESREVTLERNPHWHGPPPAIRRVIARPIGDASARLLTLVGGSADISINAVRPDLVDTVEEKPRLKIVTGRGSLLTYLMFHNEDPILRDVRVRRAIAMAIDRDQLIAVKFGGRAVKATGLIFPSHWAYSPDVVRYDFDPAAARKLLDEAGHPDPDGPGGRPRFKLSYKTSADAFRVSVARLIAQQLGDVGIEVEVRSFEFATFFNDIKMGNYQLASMQTGVIAEPDMMWSYFHTERIPSDKDRNAMNRWRYRSAEMDRLVAEGRFELDREKRKKIYAEAQRLASVDLPIVPLWHEDNVVTLNRDVEGFTLAPNARLSALTKVRKTGAVVDQQ
jgi:peptide/nickel transport system substrate-binding protein